MRQRSLWAVSVLVLLAACGDGGGGEGGGDGTVTQPTPGAASLSATLQQYREDEASDMISVKVSNPTDADVEVRTLRIEWAGFESGEPAPIDYTVFAGTRVDLRVPVSRAICSDPPRLDDALPDAPISVIAGTTAGEIVFGATDPEGVLGRIWPRDCRRQAVEHAVTFELVDWTDLAADPPTDPPTMQGTLVVERQDASVAIAIDAVHGSVLVNVGSDDLPIVMAAGEDRLEIPILATNNRCDSHALGEAKKPYLFQVDLRLGDDVVTYVVAPSEATAQALAEGIIGRCPP